MSPSGKVEMSPFSGGGMEEGVIAMSKKELTRLEVVQRVAGKQMRLAEAARQLSLSERQVKRLVRDWRERGTAGLVMRSNEIITH